MKHEEIDLSYEDLCSECEFHDKCHKNGIDYDKIDECNEELDKQLEDDGYFSPVRKPPEPKERVQFT